MDTNQLDVPVSVESSSEELRLDTSAAIGISNAETASLDAKLDGRQVSDLPIPAGLKECLEAANQHCQDDDYLEASKCYEEALKISPDSFDAATGLGVTLGMMEKLDEAKEYIEKAISIAPTSSEAHNNLGCLHFRTEQIDEAEACFKKALELNGHNVEARRNLADLHMERGDYDEALDLCEQILLGNPNDAQAFVALGNCYFKKGASDVASTCYEKALQIDPGYDDARHNLGDIKSSMTPTSAVSDELDHTVQAEVSRLDAGSAGLSTTRWLSMAKQHCEKQDYVEASKYYEEALKASPGFFEAITGMGITSGMLGKFDEAIEHFKRATTIAPDSSETYNNLGCMYVKEAEECFRKAIELNEQNAEAKRNLANLHQGKGDPDYESAKANLDTASSPALPASVADSDELDHTPPSEESGTLSSVNVPISVESSAAPQSNAPLSPPSTEDLEEYLSLADQHCRQAEYLEASRCYEEALRISPDSLDANIGLGITLGMLEKTDEAMEHLKRAIVIAPTSSEAHNNLGCLYFRQEQMDKAEDCFRKALELNGGNVEARRNLADLCFERGDYDDALGLCEQLLIGNPYDAQAFVALGNCYLKKGVRDAAMTCYEKALEIDPDYDDARNNLDTLKSSVASTHIATDTPEHAASEKEPDALSPDVRALMETVMPQLNEEERSEAEETIKALAGNGRGRIGALHYVGKLYERIGQPDGAEKIYDGIIEEDPGFVEAYYTLGDLYRQYDQLRKADHIFSRLLDQDTKQAPAWNTLGMIRLATGDLKSAKECFTQASSFDPDCPEYERNLGHVNRMIEKPVGDTFTGRGNTSPALSG